MALKQSLDFSRASRKRIDAEWAISCFGSRMEKRRYDERAHAVLTERQISPDTSPRSGLQRPVREIQNKNKMQNLLLHRRQTNPLLALRPQKHRLPRLHIPTPRLLQPWGEMQIHLRKGSGHDIRVLEIIAGDLVFQHGADFEFLLVGFLVGGGCAVGDVGAVFGWEEPFDGWAGGGEADEGDLLGQGIAAQGRDDGCYSWGGGVSFVFWMIAAGVLG